jgi:hypothetical protein
MLKIKPKCFYKQELATNAKGFLIPCCWCGPEGDNDTNFKKLIKDKFHLDKIKKITDVINSNEWQEFKKNLEESNIKNLPKICIKHCSINNNNENNVNTLEQFFDGDKVKTEIR